MRAHVHGAALLAALVLAAAGCAGGNAFPDEPLGVPGTGGAAATGSISGQVTADGAGFGGASVAIANGPSTTTDATGQFRFTGISNGSYRVSILVPVGYVLATGDSATVTATVAGGRAAVVNWRLQTTVGGGGGGTGGTTGGTGGTGG